MAIFASQTDVYIAAQKEPGRDAQIGVQTAADTSNYIADWIVFLPATAWKRSADSSLAGEFAPYTRRASRAAGTARAHEHRRRCADHPRVPPC